MLQFRRCVPLLLVAIVSCYYNLSPPEWTWMEPTHCEVGCEYVVKPTFVWTDGDTDYSDWMLLTPGCVYPNRTIRTGSKSNMTRTTLVDVFHSPTAYIKHLDDVGPNAVGDVYKSYIRIEEVPEPIFSQSLSNLNYRPEILSIQRMFGGSNNLYHDVVEGPSGLFMWRMLHYLFRLPFNGSCPSVSLLFTNRCLWPKGSALCNKCGEEFQRHGCHSWDDARRPELIMLSSIVENMSYAHKLNSFDDLKKPVCYEDVIIGVSWDEELFNKGWPCGPCLQGYGDCVLLREFGFARGTVRRGFEKRRVLLVQRDKCVRSISNLKDLSTRLRRYLGQRGTLKVVKLEMFRPKAQAKLIAASDIIILSNGAAVTWAMLMPKGGAVIVISPEDSNFGWDWGRFLSWVGDIHYSVLRQGSGQLLPCNGSMDQTKTSIEVNLLAAELALETMLLKIELGAEPASYNNNPETRDGSRQCSFECRPDAVLPEWWKR